MDAHDVIGATAMEQKERERDNVSWSFTMEGGGRGGRSAAITTQKRLLPPLLLSHSRCLEDYTHTRNLASPLQSSVQRRRKRQRVYCHPLAHTHAQTCTPTPTPTDPVVFDHLRHSNDNSHSIAHDPIRVPVIIIIAVTQLGNGICAN